MKRICLIFLVCCGFILNAAGEEGPSATSMEEDDKEYIEQVKKAADAYVKKEEKTEDAGVSSVDNEITEFKPYFRDEGNKTFFKITSKKPLKYEVKEAEKEENKLVLDLDSPTTIKPEELAQEFPLGHIEKLESKKITRGKEVIGSRLEFTLFPGTRHEIVQTGKNLEVIFFGIFYGIKIDFETTPKGKTILTFSSDQKMDSRVSVDENKVRVDFRDCPTQIDGSSFPAMSFVKRFSVGKKNLREGDIPRQVWLEFEMEKDVKYKEVTSADGKRLELIFAEEFKEEAAPPPPPPPPPVLVEEETKKEPPPPAVAAPPVLPPEIISLPDFYEYRLPAGIAMEEFLRFLYFRPSKIYKFGEEEMVFTSKVKKPYKLSAKTKKAIAAGELIPVEIIYFSGASVPVFKKK
ncbi:MAG: hypothetical protein PHD51_04700 [Patescibacteria group bacterium]|nr:hypothetical protein [Patescibacteria group bacterium]MDD5043919.1 hypothetical protein [Patescibacteria group bacterium]MDD5490752.1 hypothetical protein [Patescibacteria group bacterium]